MVDEPWLVVVAARDAVAVQAQEGEARAAERLLQNSCSPVVPAAAPVGELDDAVDPVFFRQPQVGVDAGVDGLAYQVGDQPAGDALERLGRIQLRPGNEIEILEGDGDLPFPLQVVEEAAREKGLEVEPEQPVLLAPEGVESLRDALLQLPGHVPVDLLSRPRSEGEAYQIEVTDGFTPSHGGGDGPAQHGSAKGVFPGPAASLWRANSRRVRRTGEMMHMDVSATPLVHKGDLQHASSERGQWAIALALVVLAGIPILELPIRTLVLTQENLSAVAQIMEEQLASLSSEFGVGPALRERLSQLVGATVSAE